MESSNTIDYVQEVSHIRLMRFRGTNYNVVQRSHPATRLSTAPSSVTDAASNHVHRRLPLNVHLVLCPYGGMETFMPTWLVPYPIFCIKVQQLPADVFNGRSAHAVDGVCVRFARVVQRNLCVDP